MNLRTLPNIAWIAGMALPALLPCAWVARAHASPEDGLQAEIDSIREENGVVALGGAILRESGDIRLAVSGKRKHGEAVDVQPGDLFHIGSCGKAMTATVIAILVEEGTLRWEQTIGESFPQWNGEILAEYHEVTLEQLLTHRGGVAASPPAILWAGLTLLRRTMPPSEQRERLLRGVLAVPPAAEPGTRAIYSNSGYAIAGVMAEQATGDDWETLIREKLFEPLEMHSAGFGPPGRDGSLDQPWGHEKGLFGIMPVFRDNPPAIAPAGTVHCSLADWAKFLAVHLSGEDEPRLGLSGGSIARMHAPIGNSNDVIGWGLLEDEWGGAVLMAVGSNNFWYALVMLAPEKGTALLAVSNEGTPAGFQACIDAIRALTAHVTPAE